MHGNRGRPAWRGQSPATALQPSCRHTGRVRAALPARVRRRITWPKRPSRQRLARRTVRSRGFLDETPLRLFPALPPKPGRGAVTLSEISTFVRRIRAARRYGIRLKAWILPTFRTGPEDVAAWFNAPSWDRPGTADRALEIFRATLFRAEEMGTAGTRHQSLPRHPAQSEAEYCAVPGHGRTGARSTPARSGGPKWSTRSGCRHSPPAAGARCPISAGMTSAKAPSTRAIRRPVSARRRAGAHQGATRRSRSRCLLVSAA